MRTKQYFTGVFFWFNLWLLCNEEYIQTLSFPSLLKTDQGKQLKQKETNCFSIHLIIELWLKELPFWYYQKISTKTSVEHGEEIDSFRDGKMHRDTCLCLMKAKKYYVNFDLILFLSHTL